jgi:3-deoxy-D-arabino-heptulosonate 7-phosphate (DAHP) synthase
MSSDLYGAQGWAPDSWKQRPALQMPQYPDPHALEQALARLSQLPPLVTSWEVLSLKQQLARRRKASVSFCRAVTARKISLIASRR